jgi:hypothetical protein
VEGLTSAIYERLAAQPALTAMLAPYAGSPGIFTSSPVPEEADLPYVAVSPVWHAESLNTFEDVIVRVSREIWVLWPATGSSLEIERAAELVRRAFGPPNLELPGWSVIGQSASLPVYNPADHDILSRVITVRVLAEQL